MVSSGVTVTGLPGRGFIFQTLSATFEFSSPLPHHAVREEAPLPSWTSWRDESFETWVADDCTEDEVVHVLMC